MADQFKYILSPEIVTPPDSKETPKPKGKRSDELPAGVTDKLYDSKVGYQIWREFTCPRAVKVATMLNRLLRAFQKSLRPGP